MGGEGGELLGGGRGLHGRGEWMHVDAVVVVVVGGGGGIVVVDVDSCACS